MSSKARAKAVIERLEDMLGKFEDIEAGWVYIDDPVEGLFVESEEVTRPLTVQELLWIVTTTKNLTSHLDGLTLPSGERVKAIPSLTGYHEQRR